MEIKEFVGGGEKERELHELKGLSHMELMFLL